jgi:hypothetical protein
MSWNQGYCTPTALDCNLKAPFQLQLQSQEQGCDFLSELAGKTTAISFQTPSHWQKH